VKRAELIRNMIIGALAIFATHVADVKEFEIKTDDMTLSCSAIIQEVVDLNKGEGE